MNQKYIDIHSHVNFDAYDADRGEVVSRALDHGVSFVGIGTGFGTSEQVAQMAENHEGVYAIVGLHPLYVNPSEDRHEKIVGEDFDYEKFKALASGDKVIGIGECGLDFARITSDTRTFKERQMRAFKEQLRLALELDKPVMIHCRDAYPETLQILRETQDASGGRLRGNFHFFAGSLSDLHEILALGFTVSFTGVITFAPQYEELVKATPLDKMHAETDSPFVAPKPHRGKRNEPLFVIEVVKKIAEIKGLSVKEVAEQLVKNAEELFKIGL